MPRRKPLYSLYNQTVPDTPAPSALFVIALPLLPYLIGKLEEMRRSPIWQDGENTLIGNNLLGEQIMSLIQPITSIDSIYRLLDTNLRGVLYEVATIDGIETIIPSIPTVPEVASLSIVDALVRLRDVANYFTTGIAGDSVLVPEITLQSRLQAVIDAINSDDTDTADIISQLELIATLLA